MSEERRQVLEMLSEGKISVPEAEQLLQAVATPSVEAGSDKKVEPRYFRILVNKPAREGKKAEAVNIRVPMTVVRGGLRLGALFPTMLGKKKIQLDNGMELDLSKITYADLEGLIKDIGELTVDVDGGDATVRIRCE
jgi:SHOCT-like protein